MSSREEKFSAMEEGIATGSCRSQKRMSDAMDLALLAAVNCLTWCGNRTQVDWMNIEYSKHRTTTEPQQ
ncbi:hypothetical protein STEG23_037112 [Scotinomys teguina]